MKKLITGVVIGATVATATSIFADDIVQTIQAKYMVNKISIDGVDTGKADKAFINEGTTYLGLRDIAEALDFEVTWDSTTNSIDINSNQNKQTSTNNNNYYNTTTNTNYISQDEAKQIALAKSGGGEVMSIKLDLDDDRDGRDEYDIKILNNNIYYEIEVDALTGEVTSYEIENNNNNNNNYNTSTNYISQDDAKQIALAKSGGGEVMSIKLDLDDDRDGRDEYDIKILNNNIYYEIEVDAITGEVTSYEIETNNNYNNTNSSNTTVITSQRAEEIALNKVGSGSIIKTEYDSGDRDDYPEYEIKIRSGSRTYEITINAITGEITEYELED